MKRRAWRSRKAGAGNPVGVLLDSTYLLPVFGVDVGGIDDDELLGLRRLAAEGWVTFYYSPFSLLEILAKIAKEHGKGRVGLEPDEVAATVEVIVEADYLEPAYPDSKAYALAYKMRLLGHRDMIDNILYATASSRGFLFLTLDEQLEMFIHENNIGGAPIMSHLELIGKYKP